MAKESSRTNYSGFNKDFLLMLWAPLLMAWYFYGERALRLAFISVLLSLSLSFICDLLLKKKTLILKPSAIVTGLLIPLMLPAGASFSLLSASVAFAYIVCILPFGNGEKLPFVPAAAAITFATVCRTAAVFTYPSLSYPTAAAGDPAFVEGTSLAYSLAHGNSIHSGATSVIKIFIGEYPGPMGATCTLILLAAGVYLFLRLRNKFSIFFGYILSICVFAAVFPRILTGSYNSVVMELCSGTLFFAGLFLFTQPYCSPSGNLSGFLFGIISGLLVMLFRKFGIYEDSTCFVVLIMNALSPLFTKAFDLAHRKENEKKKARLSYKERAKEA